MQTTSKIGGFHSGATEG